MVRTLTVTLMMIFFLESAVQWDVHQPVSDWSGWLAWHPPWVIWHRPLETRKQRLDVLSSCWMFVLLMYFECLSIHCTCILVVHLFIVCWVSPKIHQHQQWPFFGRERVKGIVRICLCPVWLRTTVKELCPMDAASICHKQLFITRDSNSRLLKCRTWWVQRSSLHYAFHFFPLILQCWQPVRHLWLGSSPRRAAPSACEEICGVRCWGWRWMKW